jgi:hypothetical protein
LHYPGILAIAHYIFCKHERNWLLLMYKCLNCFNKIHTKFSPKVFLYRKRVASHAGFYVS